MILVFLGNDQCKDGSMADGSKAYKMALSMGDTREVDFNYYPNTNKNTTHVNSTPYE